jgi:hypothetical protein
MMPINERGGPSAAASGQSMRCGGCCSPTSRPTTSWPLARATPCEFCELRASRQADALIGDATAARQELGWQARAYCREFARSMVGADIDDMRRFLALTPGRRESAPALWLSHDGGARSTWGMDLIS